MSPPTDLEHCIERWNTKWQGGYTNTREDWDERAGDWDGKLRADGVRARQGEERVAAVAQYLRGRGLLGPDCDVADLGCGPGRFVAEFARTARSALGIDLSERMVDFGRRYAQEAGRTNVDFVACDFQTADVAALGWEGRFDLVFASITPAIAGMTALENMMKMSRAFCCNICFVHQLNDLDDRILRECFGRGPRREFASHSHWFHELFNLLWWLGYHPETSYHRQPRELLLPAGPELAVERARVLLPPEERTPENTARIHRFLRENARADGAVLETSDCWYGRILWDVRLRTERPVPGRLPWENIKRKK
ncbi:class I SAM-dependent methyltransferase [Myxococcota bacterium]|nr:class I SAM-dependent methyltransferase [Myxococcota bacterium]